MLNGRKRRPTHPGELLREEIVPAAELTQAELAARLGVSPRSISDLLNERRSLTPDMAHRLARVFKTSPEFWMNLQQAVDIWEALIANREEYSRLRPLKAA